MKLFSPEQLALECRPLSDMALEALESRDIDALYFLLGRMSVGHQELYVGYVQWITRMFGKILTDLGERVLYDLMSESAAFLMAPYAQEFLQGDEKRSFLEILALWRNQMGGITPIRETADGIFLDLVPCGSGGRMILEAWSEALPAQYPHLPDGSYLFCRACQALQDAFNQTCGTAALGMKPDRDRAGACRMSFHKQKTKGERFFDFHECRQVVTPRCQLAIESLKKGTHAIRELIADQHREWRPLHDFLCLWVTSLLSAMYRLKGADYVADLIRETYGRLFNAIYMMYPAVDDASLFRNMVRIWYYHQATFRVEEEDDRFVFTLDPCGSGGRLFRGEMGKEGFRYGKGMLYFMDEPADVNFHRSRFPIYCTHCAVTNRDQFEGKPWAFVVDGCAMKDPFSPCVQYLYKKRSSRKIDSAILSQVGISRVSPLQEEYVL